MIAKTGLGLIGLGAIGVGGTALAKPEWFGINRGMPVWHSLAEDNGFADSTYGSAKFGGKHKKYLVGVTNKAGDQGPTHESWWKWSFKKLQQADPDKGKFAVRGSAGVKVDDWYSNSKTTSLNKVCDAAYKTEESSFHSGNEADDGNKFKKEDVWKYCSPVGQEPTTVQAFDNKDGSTTKYEGQNDQNPIGKSAEADLISVNDAGNNIFWEIRDKEFKAIQTTAFGSNQFFKDGQKQKSIKELCKEAYLKTNGSSGTASPTADETKKYCALTLSAS